MAERHKYNDFDDALLRQRIVVEWDYPHKKELVEYLRGKGYFNETVAEKLAYVFCGESNQGHYAEIARLMSAVISLKQHKDSHLCIKAMYGNDIPLDSFADQLFVRAAREHVLGVLGRGQCANFEYLLQFAHDNPALRDADGTFPFMRTFLALGKALEERNGPEYKYYGNIPEDQFKAAVKDAYDFLRNNSDFEYPWRGDELPLAGPYDSELFHICSSVFNGEIENRIQLGCADRLIEAFCNLSAGNSPLFRMLEDYNTRTYYKRVRGGVVAKKSKFPTLSDKENAQVERLKKGLFPDAAKTVAKRMPHLSFQYIYYVISGKVLAPDGYLPHSIAEVVYDLYHIISGADSDKGLSAKQKHKNLQPSFQIDTSTGLYIKGL